MPDRVTVFEVSPRDGLQNEARTIPTSDKVRLIDMLARSGLTRIEAASFVSPKWVPQMADGAGVMAGIARPPQVSYAALTPNMTGLQAALGARVDEVSVFGAASETFSRRNINASIAESLSRFAPVVSAAREAGLFVRGYISCVTDCPFEGPIAPAAVADVAARLLELGVDEISLGDTIGHGTPATITAMLDAVLGICPAERLAGHYHDTRDHALANIEVSLSRGLRIFDASAGGLGGCPYAPGAAGNVATEAVVDLLEARGFVTGIDRARLAEAGTFARTLRSMS